MLPTYELDPVTLTAQRQAAVVWTTTCWLPVEVWGVIALPVAAVDVTTGAEPGAPRC